MYVKKQLLKDAFLWGFVLWLIGYILGILFFPIVPASLLGWVITPFGVLITLWILHKKIKSDTFLYYVFLAVVWVLLAVVCDYFFLVKVFKPTDGYYKLDVYVYYVLTFVLPLFVGWRKISSK
ncbi:MAG: hypothetical protein RLZZ455_681 [Candidatus Parcubacteria bacterium]